MFGWITIAILFNVQQQVFGYYTMECPAGENAEGIRRLRSDLFCNYDTTGRPIKNISKPIFVNIALDLIYMNIVDNPEDLFKNAINTRIIINWKDERLSWDPTKYDNIEKIQVDSTSIWFPDLQFTNVADVIKPAHHDEFCILNKFGEVICNPNTILSIYCSHYSAQWPKDSKLCNVTVGSWSHTNNEVLLRTFYEGYRTDSYVENPMWKMNGFFISATPMVYPCCPDDIITVFAFNMVFERTYVMLWIVSFLPGIIIIILTLISFGINNSHLRFLLCLYSLMCNIIMFIFLGFKVPADGNKTPKIIIFYAVTITLSCLSIIITYLINLIDDAQETPEWMNYYIAVILRRQIKRGSQTMVEHDLTDEETSEMNNIENGNAKIKESIKAKIPEHNNFYIYSTLLNRIIFYGYLVIYTVMLFYVLSTTTEIDINKISPILNI